MLRREKGVVASATRTCRLIRRTHLRKRGGSGSEAAGERLNPAGDHADFGTSLIDAVREQLGRKLRNRKLGKVNSAKKMPAPNR